MTIKEIRKKFDVTQKELAAITGFTQGQISRWENGWCAPSMMSQERFKAAVRAMSADPKAVERIQNELKNAKKPKPLI